MARRAIGSSRHSVNTDALERQDSSEESEVRLKHVEYLLKLAETAEPELVGPRVGLWLARLDQDQDNFRAALQWFLERCASELGLCLAAALYRFWLLRGFLNEGSDWLGRLLALPGAAAPTSGRAKALNAAAGLAAGSRKWERALTPGRGSGRPVAGARR